jgi:hypothetical protein
MNYDNIDEFCHSAWKRDVTNCDEVLRKLICFWVQAVEFLDIGSSI